MSEAVAHPPDGVAVGAVRGDTTEFSCRGSVSGLAVSPDTVMYAASVTKQFIGMLLALGVEAGLVSPDDPVRQWLPELPGWVEPVRLHHLLHHTSGLPNLAAPSLGIPASNAEVVSRFQSAGEEAFVEPGTQFAYNNAGYVLLAEAVSRVFGRPVPELAREQLFEPLGMSASRLDGEAVRTAGHLDPPATVGDGGLWTTAAELSTWLAALNRRSIHPDAVRRLTEPGRLGDGRVLDYAWGVAVTETPYGPQITHGGTWANWLAKTVRLPDHDVAVAVPSTGGEEEDISRLGTDVARQLIEGRASPV